MTKEEYLACVDIFMQTAVDIRIRRCPIRSSNMRRALKSACDTGSVEPRAFINNVDVASAFDVFHRFERMLISIEEGDLHGLAEEFVTALSDPPIDDTEDPVELAAFERLMQQFRAEDK